MLIVQKYGGTSLADTEKIRCAARRAAELKGAGHDLVIVVSAQGDTTDLMIEKAAQINKHRAAREMDAYLAAGEQMSAGLLAMAIGALGCGAVSLTGWQAGLLTDSVYGNARILALRGDRIRRELAAGKIVIVAGFQGIDSGDNVTTLGRGGSDTTAVALAALLEADRCVIYTDVDGVYDKDPRKFADAKKFAVIDYDQMLQLCRGGAQVLHDRCVELARQHDIRVEVCSVFRDEPGTIVGRL